MSDACDVICTVDILTDLNAVLGRIYSNGGQGKRTFTIVKSQFCSMTLVKLIRATGTIQSLTGGGFG